MKKVFFPWQPEDNRPSKVGVSSFKFLVGVYSNTVINNTIKNYYFDTLSVNLFIFFFFFTAGFRKTWKMVYLMLSQWKSEKLRETDKNDRWSAKFVIQHILFLFLSVHNSKVYLLLNIFNCKFKKLSSTLFRWFLKIVKFHCFCSGTSRPVNRSMHLIFFIFLPNSASLFFLFLHKN